MSPKPPKKSAPTPTTSAPDVEVAPFAAPCHVCGLLRTSEEVSREPACPVDGFVVEVKK